MFAFDVCDVRMYVYVMHRDAMRCDVVLCMYCMYVRACLYVIMYVSVFAVYVCRVMRHNAMGCVVK